MSPRTVNNQRRMRAFTGTLVMSLAMPSAMAHAPSMLLIGASRDRIVQTMGGEPFRESCASIFGIEKCTLEYLGLLSSGRCFISTIAGRAVSWSCESKCSQ